MNEKMRFVILVAIALWSLTTSSGYLMTATAGEPCHKLLGCPVPDCIGKWCCDDYCPKKIPCVSAPLCFGCDDYCSKKAPCVCPQLCFGCDDYCKKCLPQVCSNPLYAFLRCGPPGGGCDCSDCGGFACDGVVASNLKAEPATRSLSPERNAANRESVAETETEIPVQPQPVLVERAPFEVARKSLPVRLPSTSEGVSQQSQATR